MKSFILAAVIIGACAAAVLPGYVHQRYYQERPRAALDRNAAILRSVSNVNENGYQFGFDTQNGIQREETAVESNGIQAQGGYSYTGDDGLLYAVRYIAGLNGFEARGAHLPTPPPIPEAIARALIENERDEAAGIFDDGSYYPGKYDSGVFGTRITKVVVPQYNPYRQQYY